MSQNRAADSREHADAHAGEGASGRDTRVEHHLGAGQGGAPDERKEGGETAANALGAHPADLTDERRADTAPSVIVEPARAGRDVRPNLTSITSLPIAQQRTHRSRPALPPTRTYPAARPTTGALPPRKCLRNERSTPHRCVDCVFKRREGAAYARTSRRNRPSIGGQTPNRHPYTLQLISGDYEL